MGGRGKLPGGTSDPPATPPPAPVTAAARSALDALPDGLRAEYLAAMPPELAAHFSPPADALDAFAWPEELPWVRECALALLAKGAVSLGGFRAMRDDADRHASAAAEAVAGDARRRVQQALAEAVAEGPDARAFKKRFAEELSPADAEAAFRDGMQAAYSAGLDRVLESPLVGRAYPYEENLPIRDRRLSGMCEVVSRSGLNGTAVYRRDDPVWQKLKPPRHFRCRCGRNPLTVSEAARRGVAEAREWERTGTPPAAPAFVPWPAGVEL